MIRTKPVEGPGKGEDDKIVSLDLQNFGPGRPAHDLVYFMMLCIEADFDSELWLLRSYHQASLSHAGRGPGALPGAEWVGSRIRRSRGCAALSTGRGFRRKCRGCRRCCRSMQLR